MSIIKNLFYYGFPVYYRVEHRTDGDAFIFSYRREIDGRLRLIYEHPPRRIQVLERLLQDAESSGVWIDGDGRTLLEQLPESVMDEFFHDFLDIESSAKIRSIGLERRKSIPELTLGALFAADREKMVSAVSEITGKARSAASIEDDVRTIRCLCQKEGGTRWQEATLLHCLEWLSEETVHMRRSCGRMMKKLLLPFFEMELIEDLLGWESFDPSMGVPHKPRYDGLVRSNILPNMLSYGQCQVLLEKFISPAGPGVVSGVDMALLLKLTLGLETEEICALNIESFVYLKDFSERLTVHVTHQFCKPSGRKKYQLQEIEDSHQRRILPLSHLAKQCYTAICERRKLTGTTPLVPSKSSSRRRMTPEDLDKELEERVLALFSKEYIRIAGVRAPAAKALLDATGERELRKSGCEEEELRFIQGKRPLTVSAVSYADFLNEAELNKLGALQDRWLNRVVPMPPPKETETILYKKGATIDWAAPCQEGRTQVVFKIPVPKRNPEEIPEEGITLELHALHGFSGTILWKQED